VRHQSKRWRAIIPTSLSSSPPSKRAQTSFTDVADTNTRLVAQSKVSWSSTHA
ncbi:hypothetical protein H0H93_009667, partial [Arthromyces matolae]